MDLDDEPTPQQQAAFDNFVNDLVSSLDQNKKPEFYVPEEREVLRLKNNLISNSFIIYGPTGSGKTSSVLWAASFDPDVVVLIINCDIDTTEIQFIRTLYDGVKSNSKIPNEEFISKKSSAPVFQNMKFDLLNDYIKLSGKKFVFAIKKCERIAEMKKPTLFYNLIEWVNGPMKPYLGLAFLSRAFHFTDRLQKRVKSRLTAKSITLIRPQGEKIIKIYLKRFQTLKDKYSSQIKYEKNKHKLKTPFLDKKLKWIQMIIQTIQNDKRFKQFIGERTNAINNQFLSCMKVGLIKSLSFKHMNLLSTEEFSKELVEILKDASLHISPNYYQTLIKRTNSSHIGRMSTLQYFGFVSDRLHGDQRSSSLQDVVDI